MKCVTYINQDQHEVRIKRTLKTVRAFDCADMLSNVGDLAASRAHREHQQT